MRLARDDGLDARGGHDGGEDGATTGDRSAGRGIRRVVVGDRPSTDGLFAVTLGAPFALVLSGVTTEADLPVTPEPAWVTPDLAALVDGHLASL